MPWDNELEALMIYVHDTFGEQMGRDDTTTRWLVCWLR